MLYLNNVGDPLRFSLAPPSGSHLWFLVKYLDNCWMDCYEIWSANFISSRIVMNLTGIPQLLKGTHNVSDQKQAEFTLLKWLEIISLVSKLLKTFFLYCTLAHKGTFVWGQRCFSTTGCVVPVLFHTTSFLLFCFAVFSPRSQHIRKTCTVSLLFIPQVVTKQIKKNVKHKILFYKISAIYSCFSHWHCINVQVNTWLRLWLTLVTFSYFLHNLKLLLFFLYKNK